MWRTREWGLDPEPRVSNADSARQIKKTRTLPGADLRCSKGLQVLGISAVTVRARGSDDREICSHVEEFDALCFGLDLPR